MTKPFGNVPAGADPAQPLHRAKIYPVSRWMFAIVTTTERSRSSRYVALTVILALLTGLVVNFALWSTRVSSCYNLDRDGSFLAYCGNSEFGDYEHGAFWWNWRPAAVEAMKAADVLLLGSSTAQVAFSSEATKNFFGRIGARDYVLGFGYGEQYLFEEKIITRYRLKPKVVIVSVDPFFGTDTSQNTKDIESNKIETFVSYMRKRAFIELRPWICAIHALCEGKAPSLFRRDIDGAWIGRDIWFPTSAIQPDPHTPLLKSSPQSIELWARNADQFIADVGLDRNCVILTATPNYIFDSAQIATGIGEILKIPVVLPQISNLNLADTFHLSWDSAELWSRTFFADSEPVIRRCLQGEKSS